MARIFLNLVAIAMCALATVTADYIFQGLDRSHYVVINDDGVCGPKHFRSGLRAVAPMHQFCTGYGYKHPYACNALPIHDFLDYSSDYLKDGLVPLIKCTKHNECWDIADLKFQRLFLAKTHSNGNTGCVLGGEVGVPRLCRKGNSIYAADNSGMYNDENSFRIFQQARRRGWESGTDNIEALEFSINRLYPGISCGICNP